MSYNNLRNFTIYLLLWFSLLCYYYYCRWGDKFNEDDGKDTRNTDKKLKQNVSAYLIGSHTKGVVVEK
jgi:hypothetical protein